MIEMLELEAKRELEIRIAKRQNIFCPLINSQCNINCECYNRPEILNPRKQENEYTVYYGNCTAHCLNGE